MFEKTMDDRLWDNLIENALNHASDILENVNDLDFDEEVPDGTDVVHIDSRLDSDSILLDDIDLVQTNNDANSKNSREMCGMPVKMELKPRNVIPGIRENVSKNSDIHNEHQRMGTIMNLERRESVNNQNVGHTHDLGPTQRDRCNTWPRRQPDLCFSNSSEESEIYSYNQHSPLSQGSGLSSPRSQAPGLALVSEEVFSDREDDEEYAMRGQDNYKPKLNSRRNPWDNLSYADLISKAIQSSPEKRLTLSQIYDWMISSLPYFQERADATSSAGWKNSIRHNLSLHQKFLKVQNEGAGKSSWWTINPERKISIKPRRRATSGDTRSLHIKREKAKKRMDTMKSCGRLERSSSMNEFPPSSSPPYDSTIVPHPSQDSLYSIPGNFTNFRPRSLSNASSLGGPPVSPVSTHFPTDQLNIPDLDFLSSNSVKTNKTEPCHMNNIAMEELDINGSSENMGQFYQALPKSHTLQPSSSHRIKILEARDQFSSVIKYPCHPVKQSYNYNNTLDNYVTPLHTRDNIEHNQVRRPMIIKELNQLTQKRIEVIDNQTKISADNKRNLESAFDLQIRMLQGELDKMTREEEIFRINQYSSASNNPFYMGINNTMHQDLGYNSEVFSVSNVSNMDQIDNIDNMEVTDESNEDTIHSNNIINHAIDEKLRNLHERNIEYSESMQSYDNRIPAS